jgi:hypothetical protein
MVMIAPGSKKPDDAFWRFVKQQSYRINSCVEQDACVLVNQDLNADGQPEQVLYAFGEGESLIFGMKEKQWSLLGAAQLPEGFTKATLLQAVENHRLTTAPRIWRDITLDGKRLEINYYAE